MKHTYSGGILPLEQSTEVRKPWSKDNRPTLGQYPSWYLEQLGPSLSIERVKSHYDASVATVLTTVETHPFFQELDTSVAAALAAHKSLLMSPEGLKLVRKSFGSALNKSFRHNILYNRQFPNPPKDGWLSHDNWFELMNDGVRGLIVCKYADGVQVIADALSELAKKHGLASDYDTRASDEGYYAFHFYVQVPTQYLLIDWAEKPITALVEIQITTQLQDVLRQLTHPFYEGRRIQVARDRQEWKWQLQSPEFKASYLGHTLHLLEGMIVEIKKEIVRLKDAEGPIDEKK